MVVNRKLKSMVFRCEGLFLTIQSDGPETSRLPSLNRVNWNRVRSWSVGRSAAIWQSPCRNPDQYQTHGRSNRLRQSNPHIREPGQLLGRRQTWRQSCRPRHSVLLNSQFREPLCEALSRHFHFAVVGYRINYLAPLEGCLAIPCPLPRRSLGIGIVPGSERPKARISQGFHGDSKPGEQMPKGIRSDQKIMSIYTGNGVAAVLPAAKGQLFIVRVVFSIH